MHYSQITCDRVFLFLLLYQGPKISATSFKNYLIVVSPPFFPTGSSASATVRNYVARTPNASAVDVSKLTILDMENHLTAYSGATFVEGVRDVFVHDGTVYVLGNDTKAGTVDTSMMRSKT